MEARLIESTYRLCKKSDVAVLSEFLFRPSLRDWMTNVSAYR